MSAEYNYQLPFPADVVGQHLSHFCSWKTIFRYAVCPNDFLHHVDVPNAGLVSFAVMSTADIFRPPQRLRRVQVYWNRSFVS
jgi:hypothetical protein